MIIQTWAELQAYLFKNTNAQHNVINAYIRDNMEINEDFEKGPAESWLGDFNAYCDCL